MYPLALLASRNTKGHVLQLAESGGEGPNQAVLYHTTQLLLTRIFFFPFLYECQIYNGAQSRQCSEGREGVGVVAARGQGGIGNSSSGGSDIWILGMNL